MLWVYSMNNFGHLLNFLMKVSKFKISLLLLLQLVFAGQVVASSMIHCPMMMQDSSTSQQDHDMDHSAISHSTVDHSKMGHKMNSKNMNDHNMSPGDSMDCCTLAGDCESSNCFNFTMLSQNLLISSSVLNSQVFFLPQTQLFRLHSNLYRPPIFA